MTKEGSREDSKLTFDSTNPKAKLDLVKDILAIANSGGGRITFGRSETEVVGLSQEVIKSLDSARIADLVDRYIPPSTIRLSHQVLKPEPSKTLVVLFIDAPDHPLVVSKPGTWTPPGKKRQEPVLRRGDIWVRHSSKNEPASHEDLRSWLSAARSDERSTMLEQMAMLVNLPAGSTVQVVTKSGVRIDTPSLLIESARDRRRWDPNHLLTGEDLLWIYSQRANLNLSDEDLGLLVASALRKTATLHYWLALADHSPSIIVKELISALSAGDRDKSDAGKNVIELAGFYADDKTLQQIVDELARSNYKHFREAASAWRGRSAAKAEFSARVHKPSYEDTKLTELAEEQLEEIGDELAAALREKSSLSRSRKLSDLNRVIWARKTNRDALLKAHKK